jgi:hypothetical protein
VKKPIPRLVSNLSYPSPVKLLKRESTEEENNYRELQKKGVWSCPSAKNSNEEKK